MLQNIQNNRLKERRVQYIRTHRETFDIEPTFPLPLFEELILEIESSLLVTVSCKIESGQLLAGRFEVCPFQKTSWPDFLTHTFKFLDKIENRLGARINRDSFEQFVAAHIGSRKIMDNTMGIYLGSKLEDARAIVYIHFDPEEDPEELARTAIALDGGYYSDELIQVMIRDMIVIRFEFFFDGRSHMELCLGASGCPGTFGIRGKYLTPYIQKYFSQKVNSIFREAYFFKISFSKVYETPILAFYFKNIKDIPKYFRLNSLGDRVYDFFKSQSCITNATMVVKEAELESSRAENFCLYYTRHE